MIPVSENDDTQVETLQNKTSLGTHTTRLFVFMLLVTWFILVAVVVGFIWQFYYFNADIKEQLVNQEYEIVELKNAKQNQFKGPQYELTHHHRRFRRELKSSTRNEVIGNTPSNEGNIQYSPSQISNKKINSHKRRHIPAKILRYYLLLLDHIKKQNTVLSNYTVDENNVAQKFIDSVGNYIAKNETQEELEQFFNSTEIPRTTREATKPMERITRDGNSYTHTKHKKLHTRTAHTNARTYSYTHKPHTYPDKHKKTIQNRNHTSHHKNPHGHITKATQNQHGHITKATQNPKHKKHNRKHRTDLKHEYTKYDQNNHKQGQVQKTEHSKNRSRITVNQTSHHNQKPRHKQDQKQHPSMHKISSQITQSVIYSKEMRNEISGTENILETSDDVYPTIVPFEKTLNKNKKKLETKGSKYTPSPSTVKQNKATKESIHQIRFTTQSLEHTKMPHKSNITNGKHIQKSDQSNGTGDKHSFKKELAKHLNITENETKTKKDSDYRSERQEEKNGASSTPPTSVIQHAYFSINGTDPTKNQTKDAHFTRNNVLNFQNQTKMKTTTSNMNVISNNKLFSTVSSMSTITPLEIEYHNFATKPTQTLNQSHLQITTENVFTTQKTNISKLQLQNSTALLQTYQEVTLWPTESGRLRRITTSNKITTHGRTTTEIYSVTKDVKNLLPEITNRNFSYETIKQLSTIQSQTTNASYLFTTKRKEISKLNTTVTDKNTPADKKTHIATMRNTMVSVSNINQNTTSSYPTESNSESFENATERTEIKEDTAPQYPKKFGDLLRVTTSLSTDAFSRDDQSSEKIKNKVAASEFKDHIIPTNSAVKKGIIPELVTTPTKEMLIETNNPGNSNNNNNPITPTVINNLKPTKLVDNLNSSKQNHATDDNLLLSFLQSEQEKEDVMTDKHVSSNTSNANNLTNPQMEDDIITEIPVELFSGSIPEATYTTPSTEAQTNCSHCLAPTQVYSNLVPVHYNSKSLLENNAHKENEILYPSYETRIKTEPSYEIQLKEFKTTSSYSMRYITTTEKVASSFNNKQAPYPIQPSPIITEPSNNIHSYGSYTNPSHLLQEKTFPDNQPFDINTAYYIQPSTINIKQHSYIIPQDLEDFFDHVTLQQTSFSTYKEDVHTTFVNNRRDGIPWPNVIAHNTEITNPYTATPGMHIIPDQMETSKEDNFKASHILISPTLVIKHGFKTTAAGDMMLVNNKESANFNDDKENSNIKDMKMMRRIKQASTWSILSPTELLRQKENVSNSLNMNYFAGYMNISQINMQSEVNKTSAVSQDNNLTSSGYPNKTKDLEEPNPTSSTNQNIMLVDNIYTSNISNSLHETNIKTKLDMLLNSTANPIKNVQTTEPARLFSTNIKIQEKQQLIQDQTNPSRSISLKTTPPKFTNTERPHSRLLTRESSKSGTYVKMNTNTKDKKNDINGEKVFRTSAQPIPSTNPTAALSNTSTVTNVNTQKLPIVYTPTLSSNFEGTYAKTSITNTNRRNVSFGTGATTMLKSEMFPATPTQGSSSNVWSASFKSTTTEQVPFHPITTNTSIMDTKTQTDPTMETINLSSRTPKSFSINKTNTYLNATLPTINDTKNMLVTRKTSSKVKRDTELSTESLITPPFRNTTNKLIQTTSPTLLNATAAYRLITKQRIKWHELISPVSIMQSNASNSSYHDKIVQILTDNNKQEKRTEVGPGVIKFLKKLLDKLDRNELIIQDKPQTTATPVYQINWNCHKEVTQWSTAFIIGMSRFLQSHKIKCKQNEFMQGFQLVDNNKEFFPLFRYEFTCCSISLKKPH